MSTLTDFATRLKNARLTKGWSMDKLCENMDPPVSKMTISRYEKGEILPSSTHLIALANALGKSCDYFVRPITFQLETVHFRKKSCVTVKETRRIEQETADRLENYIELEEICGESSSEKLPIYEVSSINDIIAAAEDLRKKWGIGKNGITNVIDLFESHGIKVIEIDAPDSFDGLSSMVCGEIPTIVLAYQKKFSERKRLTASHELGHLVLKFDNKITEKEQESLCNRFATEMLLPEKELKEILGENLSNYVFSEVRSVQKRYGISFDAVMYKMKECGIIPEKRYIGYRIYKSKNPEYKANVEVNYWHEECSDKLLRLAGKAYSKGLITLSKAACLLNKDVAEIHRELVL